MIKFILPVLIIGLSGVVFFYFTTPVLKAIDDLKVERTSLASALDIANKLKARQNQLNDIFNAIDPTDRDKLKEMLPNNIDNVRLIIDINNIAKRHGLLIKSPNIAKDDAKAPAAAPAPTANPNQNQNSSVVISFSVSTSYEVLKLFLDDLSRSLRVVDIESLSFAAGGDGRDLFDYKISLRTYWLK